jgi:Tfp pilus assembly protein PilN
MIKINLLPFEDRVQKKSLVLPNLWSVVIYGLFIGLIGCIAFFWFSQGGHFDNLMAHQQQLQQEEKRLALQTKAIERMELQRTLLEDRLSILRQLETHRFDNVEWLNSVNTVLPKNLWLNRITRNGAGNRITVEGVADGFIPVSKMMASMESHFSFDRVQLITSERHTDSARSLIYFNIASNWGAEQSPAPEAEVSK